MCIQVQMRKRGAIKNAQALSPLYPTANFLSEATATLGCSAGVCLANLASLAGCSGRLSQSLGTDMLKNKRGCRDPPTKPQGALASVCLPGNLEIGSQSCAVCQRVPNEAAGDPSATFVSSAWHYSGQEEGEAANGSHCSGLGPPGCSAHRADRRPAATMHCRQ